MLASTVKFSKYDRSRTPTPADATTATQSGEDTAQQEPDKQRLIPQDPTVCQTHPTSPATFHSPQKKKY